MNARVPVTQTLTGLWIWPITGHAAACVHIQTALKGLQSSPHQRDQHYWLAKKEQCLTPTSANPRWFLSDQVETFYQASNCQLPTWYFTNFARAKVTVI